MYVKLEFRWDGKDARNPNMAVSIEFGNAASIEYGVSPCEFGLYSR